MKHVGVLLLPRGWGASHRTVTPKVSLRYAFIHLGAKTQTGKTTIFLNTEIVQSNGKIPGLAAWPPRLDEFDIDNWKFLDPFYEKGGV